MFVDSFLRGIVLWTEMYWFKKRNRLIVISEQNRSNPCDKLAPNKALNRIYYKHCIRWFVLGMKTNLFMVHSHGATMVYLSFLFKGILITLMVSYMGFEFLWAITFRALKIQNCVESSWYWLYHWQLQSLYIFNEVV